MDDIKQYSLQADLALAAYATLSSGEPNTANLEAIAKRVSIDFVLTWPNPATSRTDRLFEPAPFPLLRRPVSADF